MIQIVRLQEPGLIKSAFTHPKIWPWISDDGSPPADRFEPNTVGPFLYLGAFDGKDYGGCWLYHPHNHVCLEVHTCCLPHWWGPKALEAARRTLRWVVDNTTCRKVITHVPVTNRAAYRFARRVGMIDEGTNRASFQKDGVLIDQHILGITEGEICQQPRE